ncbi:MAG: hypothetical protein ACRDMV_08705 [Streptosporangiales bacterium]
MSAFDLWPFTDVSTVERRGELQVLAGISPDGLPVTITRLTPDTARDAALRQRFKDAVEAATRHTGPDDPPILWADTSTLVPWAATYDDADHRGADLIGHIFESDVAAPEQTSHVTRVPQQSDSEKSVPALDPNAYGSYGGPAQTRDAPAPQYDTPRPLYDTPRPVEHTTPHPGRLGQPAGPGGPPRPPGGGGTSGGDGKGGGASRTPLFIGLGVGGLVVVLLLGSLVALAATRERDTSGDPGKVPTAAQSSSSTPTNQITTAPAKSSPTASSSPTESAKPKLKDVKPVSVYGPTWKKGDDTYLMAFSQLGWAYRAPGDFDCLVREHTSAKTRITCTKLLGKKSKSRRVLLVDRKCSGKSCSGKEQKKVEKDPWGRKVHNWKRKGKHTKYVTGTFHNTDNDKKYFGFYMSYYYKDGKGHRNRHVLAYGDAPAKSKYAKQIQKTINSIRTQSGA